MRFAKIFIVTLVIGFMAAFSPGDTAAQPAPQRITKQATDTSINADTVEVGFNELSSDITSLTITVVRIADTAAGTVYLQGRNLASGTWHMVDTFTLTNVALQEQVTPITSMTYYDYRALYYSTNTGRRVLKITYVRRPDDR